MGVSLRAVRHGQAIEYWRVLTKAGGPMHLGGLERREPDDPPERAASPVASVQAANRGGKHRRSKPCPVSRAGGGSHYDSANQTFPVTLERRNPRRCPCRGARCGFCDLGTG